MKLIVVRTLLIDAGGTAELGESGAWQEAGCPGRRAGMPWRASRHSARIR